MTPAEFDTRRRLLGLSVEEAAGWIGVNPSTINRYVNGRVPVHADVPARLDELKDKMGQFVSFVASKAKREEVERVDLTRYRTQPALDASPHAGGMPLGAHAMMIGWTVEALEGSGFAVLIEFADA